MNAEIQSGRFRVGEIIFYVLTFLLVHLHGTLFQAPLTHNDGKGWEGVHYCQMAQQFVQSASLRGEAPFCYRLGAPFLAGLANPGDLLQGFKTVNLAANVLTLILFVIWLRLFVPNYKIRCLLALLLLTQWLGPFRDIYWDRANTNNLGQLFTLLGLFCLHWASTRPAVAAGCLSLVIFVGVAFWEPVFLVAIAMLFAENPIRFDGLLSKFGTLRFAGVICRPRLVLALPIAFGVAGIALCQGLVNRTNDYSYFRTALDMAYSNPWFSYIHALFISFGPLIVLLVYNWKRSLIFLASNQALFAFIAASCLWAYLGGRDTERFLYFTMPVTYVLIGRAIADLRPLLETKGLILLLCFSQAIAQRIFWTLPDYPNTSPASLPLLTVLGNRCQVLDLYSLHGRRMIEIVSFAEYAVLAVAILWWLNRRARLAAESC